MQCAVIEPELIEKVICYGVESASDFSCHLQGSVDELEQLNLELQAICNGKASAMPLSDHQLFTQPLIAKSLLYGTWYRAQALQAAQIGGQARVLVQYVDYGNKEWVERSNLRVITQPELLAAPAQSVHCSLAGLPQVDGVLTQEQLKEQCEWLTEQFSKEFLAAFVEHDEVAAKWSVILAYSGEGEFTTVNEAYAKRFNHVFEPYESILEAMQGKKVHYPRNFPPASHEALLDKTSGKRNEDLLNNNVSELELLEPEGKKTAELDLETVLQSMESQCGVRSKSFDLLELPCGDSSSGYITSVRSPSVFYAQLNSTYDQFQRMNGALQHLMAEQSKSQPPPSVPCVGGVYVAQFSQDTAWYRAALCWSADDGVAEVLFIDYGNAERVTIDKLYQLPSADADTDADAALISTLPAQAVVCCLAEVVPAKGAATWSAEAIDIFGKVSANREVQFTVVGKRGNVHLVTVLADSTDVRDSLLQPGVAERCEFLPERLLASSRFAVPGYIHVGEQPDELAEVPVKTLERCRAMVTFVECKEGEEASFFVQLQSDAEFICALQTALNAFFFEHRANWLALSLKANQVRDDGFLVAVRSSRDELFYRARVERVSDSSANPSVTVRLIDFGELETLPCSDTRLFSLPVLRNAPPFCRRVRLGFESPAVVACNRRMLAKFRELVQPDLPIILTPVENAEDRVIVCRLADGFNVSAAVFRQSELPDDEPVANQTDELANQPNESQPVAATSSKAKEVEQVAIAAATNGNCADDEENW